jgi:hypothetical protein
MATALQPIHWARVLDDIAWQLGEPEFAFPHARKPAGSRAVADYLRVNRSTLLRWIDGSEPRHSDGEVLLIAWCRLSGKVADFAPRQRAVLSAAKMR